MAQSTQRGEVQDAFPPIAFDVRTAAKTLCISKSQVYKLIASGDLYHRRVGKRVLIPRKAIEAFMEGRPFVAGVEQ